MKKKILYIQAIHPAGMDLLRNKYNVVVANNEAKSFLLNAVADTDAIVTRLTEIDKDIIEAGKCLKAIAKNGIGVDNIDVQAATENGIAVLTTGAANTGSVAEAVIFAMGAMYKKTVYFDRAMHNKNWKCRDEGGFYDVAGRTFGIVGLGRIGGQVAQIAKAFHMKVLVCDAVISREQIETMGYTCAESMEELCRKADVISLHMPLTEENTRIINEHTLSLMKPTAYVINFSRGAMVDEDALYQALVHKKIAGAALDAFAPEPPDFTHPLYGLDRVLLSPHTAGISEDARKQMSLQIARGIDDVLSGKIPECCVNRI
ncbi:hydroxyacid dehydrogenase [Bacilliculturomica massiliensis]|uniref:hydroxyacid dehydrogenase n=1 Tax=Bacilliculturomica massiliensis TaxID=1917867 RepID=UPI001030915C|nr:hydroxyacid dehydrogenase [Bacilliculturomica massiliensis]